VLGRRARCGCQLIAMPATAAWQPAFADRSAHVRASEIRDLLKVLDRPGIISFAGGIPNPQLFPRDRIAAELSAIQQHQALGPAAFQYSVTEGYGPLRGWIVQHMGSLGVVCDIDNIVVTSGSQQALDLLGKLFLQSQDTALVARPTYLGALQAFNAYQTHYDTLNTGSNAPTVATYRARAAGRGGRVSLAYVVSEHANPTGTTLPLEERRKLLDLSEQLDIPIVEDAAYQGLHYDGEPAISCLSLEFQRRGSIEACRVVYCGTFSKTVAPGLRVGWICAAKAVTRQIALIKQGSDLHTGSLSQMLIYEVVRRAYADQVAKVVAVYRRRRDILLDALNRYLRSDAQWTPPAGGMFVWVTLYRKIDAADLLRSALETHNIAFVPGAPFYYNEAEVNTLRLSFSLPEEASIAEGVERLAQTLHTYKPSEPHV
jgi:DNA-binding transcriptional MocR family regulator